ncbi:hypothetical protein AC579_9179 [Pseudocercospora musae]|uniref:Uncharacterized protein n=1 Tax=Pseudocercospora musae TaxID=113226 RepID=A0A139I7B6_9PEZI|nr:hypothetical protein AC579_9179 [Pseudocercospora musae]
MVLDVVEQMENLRGTHVCSGPRVPDKGRNWLMIRPPKSAEQKHPNGLVVPVKPLHKITPHKRSKTYGVKHCCFGLQHLSLFNSSSAKMRSMTTLNLAVTWEPRRGEPVQVSGLGILPAVSLDFSNDSMAVSDCRDLTRCCDTSDPGRCCKRSGSATDAGAVSMREERKEGSKSTGKMHSDTTYQKKGP